MKTFTPSLGFLAVVLLFGTTALSAQSSAVTTSLAKAGRHLGTASGEAFTASGASVAASGQVVSGIAAVPVWMSGGVVKGSGHVLTALGEGTTQTGAAIGRGADKLWDFSTGDAASRPPMARERAVPPAPGIVRKPKDPSPAEAMRAR